MGQGEALGIGGQQIPQLFAGGEQRVLQPHGLFPLLIPPEQAAFKGAVYPVQMGHPPVLKGVVGLGAAPGVDKNGVHAIGQRDVVIPGGAHGADVPHIGQILIHGHHAGDAPLGGHLVDEIRLGHAQLGQGLFQVVQHYGHRAVSADVLHHALAGQGVAVGHDGLGIRDGLRLLLGGCGGIGRAGGGDRAAVRALLLSASGQGNQQRRR